MSHFSLYNRSDKQKKNIILVGAGIGGLCTGIRLQHGGFNVTIYEKNSSSGGCIKYILSEDGRFKIDESASLAINPLTYDKIFMDLGKNPRDYYRWIPLENYYKVFTYDGHEFYLCTNLIKTQEQLKKYYEKEVEGYTKFVFDTSYKYLIAKENILNRPFINKRDFYSFKTMKSLGKLRVLSNADDYIKNYIKEKELQQLILFQTLFMGVSPYRIPNIYTAVAANTQVEGLAHIEGGLSAYLIALEKLFCELGGKIQYNSTIENLIIKDRCVKGILNNGKFINLSSHKVILNVDYIYGQQKLLHRKIGTSKKFLLQMGNRNNVDLSCSTFIIHLGFDKKYKGLEVHNIFLNEEFKEEIGRIFEGKLPRNPSLYIYYPSAKDNSFCKKPDESVMNIMVRVPNLQELDIIWDESTKNMLKDSCIKILQNMLNVEDLKSNILFCSITSPKDFQKKYNYYKGACFGIGHTFFQSMAFRPQIRDKELKNLYYVGGSIHPGNGASIVMECAEIVSEDIIRNTK